MRVLAAAYRAYGSLPDSFEPEQLEQELIFIGLTGMIDPVRPEVKAAARFETDSYKEDGVLKVLKKLLHREAPFCFNDCENR